MDIMGIRLTKLLHNLVDKCSLGEVDEVVGTITFKVDAENERSVSNRYIVTIDRLDRYLLRTVHLGLLSDL
jgi:hypothetical protein